VNYYDRHTFSPRTHESVGIDARVFKRAVPEVCLRPTESQRKIFLRFFGCEKREARRMDELGTNTHVASRDRVESAGLRASRSRVAAGRLRHRCGQTYVCYGGVT
jgi:hypothetical protein